MPKSAAVNAPNFFPAQKVTTPPPSAQENDEMENFLHDNGYIETEVTDTDPFTAENILPPHPRRHRTLSSSSSVNEYSRPADISTPTYAQIVTHNQRARTSSSSSSASLRTPPPGQCRWAHSFSLSLMDARATQAVHAANFKCPASGFKRGGGFRGK